MQRGSGDGEGFFQCLVRSRVGDDVVDIGERADPLQGIGVEFGLNDNEDAAVGLASDVWIDLKSRGIGRGRSAFQRPRVRKGRGAKSSGIRTSRTLREDKKAKILSNGKLF